MKKIFVFFAAAVAGLTCVSAQNFTLKVLGTEIKGGETIEACAKVNFDDVWSVPAYMELTNTSSSDIQITATADFAEGSSLQGSSTISLCGFGGCLEDWKIMEPKTVKAGQTVGADHVLDAFDYSYFPDKTLDPIPTVTINCTITDVAAEKSLSFTIKFDATKDAPSVANEAPAAQAAISAYPNPAVDQVNFRLENVKAGSVVVLRDLSGKTVRRMSVDGAAEMNMNLNGLASGMYFYSVEENGSTVAVGKLMVR